MKGILLLLKDSLEPLKTKFVNTWLQFPNKVFDKVDYIVNKYNNTYHGTIKMKPVDVNSNKYIESSKGINNKNNKFEIGDTVRISNIKTFLQKFTPQTSINRFLWLNQLKMLRLGLILLIILMEKKLLELSRRRIAKNKAKGI